MSHERQKRAITQTKPEEQNDFTLNSLNIIFDREKGHSFHTLTGINRLHVMFLVCLLGLLSRAYFCHIF